MSAASHGYRMLLQQLLNNTANFRMMKRITLLLVLAEAILLALYRPATQSPVPLLIVCVPWGLLQGWCGAFMSSAVLQNRPEYACLVPQLRSRLMKLTAALYGANGLVLGLLAGVVFGHAGYGLLAAVTISVLSLFMQRFTALSWGMVLVVPAIVPLLFNVLPHILIAVDQELAVTAAGLLLLALPAAWGLHLIFPQGGERHWAWQAKFSRQQDALLGKAAKASALHGGQRWRQWLGRLYAGALRRDSQAGVAPARRMMHVLGPAAHGGRHIAYALLATAGVLLLWQILGEGYIRNGLLSAVGVLQLSATLGYVIGVVDNVPRYRAEQSMYFLTPGAPAAAAINRLIGQTLLLRFLGVWLVTLACAVLLDSIAAGELALHGGSFALAMGMLWLARPLLRNYATVKADGARLDGMIAVVLVALIILAIMAVVERGAALPWHAIGVVLGIAAILDLARCWRRLMALPPVLPAGRLAA